VITPDFHQIFEPELLAEIENYGQLRKAHDEDVILNYGDIVRNMPLVLSGSIKVLRQNDQGQELLLYFINPLESCAMTFTCCMQQYPSEIKAVAEGEVEFISLPVRLMDEWLVKYPTWKSFVMRTIRTRFTELLNTLDQVAFQKMDERLENYLRMRSEQSGSRVINVSHEEIAQDLASSRVVISRLLKKMENDGRLLLYRNQIKLLAGF
jgi:CRP/FNR family transcriptional regulator